MACDRVDLGGGDFAFICSRGRRRPACSVAGRGRTATFECDYPLKPGARRRTCDAKLCEAHARVQAGKRGSDGSAVCHYCPVHDRAPKQLDLGETR